MSKAKTASKNNPTSRERPKEFFRNGQKITPVKLFEEKGSFLAAEYEASGELVLGSNGKALPWNLAKSSS
ncbi:MAG TPA: hypothetical protein LFW21_02680 [Rickettsia endosymbiont of Pyrocoelia pectoralis]|nr:hypothetical protein [Rickettsia endosymbiont of Pyrocoelia pectoralis]